MSAGQRIYQLKGKVQHYTWGGYDFIPQLLQMENKEEKPFAEYWLGAHPNQPSLVQVNGSEVSLKEFIEQNPEDVLGQAVCRQFGTLPYLLKVLDVRQMLSIQVHPDKRSAEAGYAAENEAGIPVAAAHRNYKDDNHKPEMMVALSDFWLLHGFKPAQQLREVLAAVPEFSFLLDAFEQGGYKGVYETVMLMEQERVNELLEGEVTRILPLYHNGELLKKQEEFWVARAAETYCKNGQYDRGIFSIYLFNLVHLKKGEGIFQPAQLPHAYLEGQNVELMASSDNVLRAGLTDKHIDVPELMKHVRFEETVPRILGAHEHRHKETHFAVPAPEFELYHYRLDDDHKKINAYSAEIVLVLEGVVDINARETALHLKRGQAAFVCAGTQYELKSTAATEIYRAAVPKNQSAADRDS